jgi:4-hydroxybenzoate polyprenyltransferase
MLKKVQKIISMIEDANVSFGLFVSTFLAIILVRTLVEEWLADFSGKDAAMFVYEFYHKFFFFLIALIFFTLLLSKTLKTSFKKIANVLLFGYLILVTPPMVDSYLSGGRGYWSFYDFGSLPQLVKNFFTFFDNTPEIGITYGVRFEIILSLIFIFMYSLIKLYGLNNDKYQITNDQSNPKIKNKKIFNIYEFIHCKLIENCKLKIVNLKSGRLLKSLCIALIVTISAYSIFYILGTFPSWFTILFQGFSKGFLNVTDVDTATLFITPGNLLSSHINDFVSALNVKLDIVYSLFITLIILAIFWSYSRTKLIAFIKNSRFPQIIYHSGLLIVGMGLGIYFTNSQLDLDLINILAIILALESVVCAWLASVVVNDIEDEEIDKITNPARPLPQKIFTREQYSLIGIILFVASLVFSSIISVKMTMLLAFYQAIAWIYSASPIRLKRFPLVSTFVSAVASLMVLFSGYIIVSPEQNIHGLPFSIIMLLAVSYTLSLPTKDLKDIEGDKRNGVYTIPVVFGEKWGRIIIGSGIFFSFFLSVIFLNEPRLFWWAVIFGSLSFWIVAIVPNKKIYPVPNYKFWYGVQPKRLPWWILGTVTVYGIILVRIIFLK